MATLSSPTLQTLITTVRGMLNQPDPRNSFWNDLELAEYLNEAIRMYFIKVVAINEGYFTAYADLNIVSGSETVALPTDCFQVKNLYKTVQNGYSILPYRNNLTEGYSTAGDTVGTSYLPDYSFQGNNILLHPVPNFSETAGLRLEYLQLPATIINGGDAVTAQVSPLFKQVLEAYAIWKAKLKESLVSGVSVHAPAEGYLQTQVKEFNDAIQKRSKNPTYIIPFNP